MAQKISYLGPKIWELLPHNIKDLEKLNIFKQILNFGSLKTERKKVIVNNNNNNNNASIIFLTHLFSPHVVPP